ncbi:FAD-dependent oxidoreductase [Roseovarius sp. SCSIO 43702]|uniref:flavin monoamine oxidase family protein n=1 Tax=Roseovarius sp. SCSIO 43702 TaxID=2823043 RepID=UPI001C73724C|nr:NAD(P)/FAD-dependent oxidoreductase [Roseovarius sp. SCSIO 43702]QYX55543.1 FAD-dependent oxidoreductase [Roseovarius sp. SCSIO 43702]
MTSRHPAPVLHRRAFVSLCGAGVVLPSALGAQSARPSAPDVVIVGAGAAGIAAAHVLRDAGLSHVHLEASGRVGGRAFTESTTFGIPYDHGAHWVQNETANPYFNRARTGDYRFYEAPETYGIYTDDRPATEAEVARMWDAWDEVTGAMAQAGRAGRDVSPASVAPSDDPWHKTAWFGIGPWEMGKDMEDFSCLDWWNSADSTDWYCAEGYGRLVADHARGLPVELRTPATRILWGGNGVEVETPNGTIRARAVIVTVSTGVLARGGIAFDPPLPPEKEEAFDGISMGDYNHIALRFSEDVFGLGEDGYLLHRVPDGREGFGALTNASGTGLAYCDVGGSFARELEKAGQAAALDFVRTRLRDMIGADADRHLVGAAVTAWSSDPHYRGAYASARPGAILLREVLRAPVADRVFFAGEACHPSLWATVGGADLSGRETARAVIAQLAG